MLIREVIEDKIRKVVIGMKNGEATGPEGFAIDFFKRTGM